MLFISVEDFFERAKGATRLTREEEKQCAQAMAESAEARRRLIYSYLPQVAARIKHAPQKIQTLQTVYTCLDALEKGVDSFNFLQDNEKFSHRLSHILRQCITRCIAYA